MSTIIQTHPIAVFCALWFLASCAFGMLVGRFIRGAR